MELKSMKLKKRSKAELPSTIGEEKWPWGLRITLDNDALSKLGIDVTSLEVKTLVPIKGMGRIKSVSSYDDERGKRDSMELQIEKLALGGDLEGDDDLDWDDRGDAVDRKLKKRGLLK